MGQRAQFRFFAAAAVIGLLLSGCGQNELGRYTGYQPNMWVVKDPKRIRFDIVKSENYWIQKEVEPEEQFPGPTPDDLEAPDEDYILGPGDLIDITVFELMQPGQPYVTRQRISQSGRITFPYLGTVTCAGLTTRGLEEKMGDLLDPDYLADPQVTVFVSEYRNLSVSVLNGVARAGIYPMTKQEMTLLELVAMAGGIMQLTEDYGYVIREYSPDEADMLLIDGTPAKPEGEAAPGAEAAPPAGEAAPPAGEAAPPAGEAAPPAAGDAAPAPAAGAVEPKPGSVAPEPGKSDSSAARPDAAEVQNLLERMAEGQIPGVREIEAAEVATPADAPGTTGFVAAANPPQVTAPAGDEAELGRWIWSDGKWIEVKPKDGPEAAGDAPPVKVEPDAPAVVEPVRLAKAEPKPADAPETEPERLALEQKLRRLGVVQGAGQLRRIIRFDVEALQAGDPTQNIVLRDSDIITIPSPPIGDFYMAGQVARPGVYSLTGRKITVLQAVAAAGGLTAVAVPWRTEIVRRISESEQEIIYVDLGKISRGQAPDFYVQPEDQIRVGTDHGAVYNAVLRNAFRATYGLGFVYDMNYADFYPWTDYINPIFDTPF